MGKTFQGSHKHQGVSGNASKSCGGQKCTDIKKKTFFRGDKRSDGSEKVFGKRGLVLRGFEGVSGRDGSACLVNTDSCEVWCVCKLVKPCQKCRERDREDNDSAPTPDNKFSRVLNGYMTISADDEEDRTESGSVTPKSDENHTNGVYYKEDCLLSAHLDNLAQCNRIYPELGSKTNVESKLRNGLPAEKCLNQTNNAGLARNLMVKVGEERVENGFKNGATQFKSVGFYASDLSEASESIGINLEELFQKLDELNKAHEGLACEQGINEPRLADSPHGTPSSEMDSASVCSGFDHFDFDTSFCSLKSTDMMEHGDLADQLSMVQQMVVEMKTGFSRAMEELSKIQYGDQTLQQQLADNTRQCHTEITTLTSTVHDIKSEVEKLTGRLDAVSETQRSLQEKLDAYQSDKSMLLEELERSGAISEQTRLRLLGGTENNNTIPHNVAPMVHPYLNSLQNHHRGVEDYHSDSSLTAAVSRSLNLTQALGEKCLNLDLSMTSTDEDEDNSRHSRSRSGSGHRGLRHRKPVAREEAARDIVDVEREYCSQLWSLMEDFMNPLRDETIVGRGEFNLLFPAYIPHIYEQHCIILRKMEERIKKWKNGGVIGDVFAQFTESQDCEGLMLYKEFINDFPTMINTMNKWFTHSPHFRELMQSQCLANSPVLQLLLAPLQQVPKYSILLKSMLKYTPLEHPDRYFLESSLGRLKQFLNSMNDDLEQAMQAIDSNNTTMNRTRETGNSAHSKSSTSSGEVNQKSRDSGVHSNEEEIAKSSSLSPNTTRRHLLQVLKEKREQREQRAKERQDGQPSTPRGQKTSYGSHPDLHNQFNATAEGRISPYLASLPQSRMFSSLSKLPLPRENGISHKSRSRKQFENQRPVINPHYLRPLTPQVFPNSGTHNFENVRRREELAEIMSQRPQSAMEYSYRLHGQHDEYLAMLAQQAGLEFSPPHSTSSDRSRQDLQLSLQKLLAETGHTQDEIGDHDQTLQEGRVSYHEQFLATKNKILRHKEQLAANGGFDQLQDDYGTFEDEDNDVDDTQNVTPMKLLPESHRPKIMVPRWRQTASPPSYNQSVTNGDRKLTGHDVHDANLASSLAQSLFENNKHHSFPRDKSFNHQRQPSEDNTNNFQGTASLKRKGQTITIESPRKSSAGQSPMSNGSKGKSAAKSLSFDVSPHRPSSLDINSEGASSSNKRNRSVTKSDKDVTKRNSITKLSDVIAYTADCLENNELKKHEHFTNDDDGDQVESPRKASAEGQSAKLTKLDILGNTNMKVSSVDNAGSSEEHSADDHMDSDNKTSNEPSKKVNTDSVVFYFQNRDKLNQGITNGVDSQRSPVFLGVNKTSTPVREQKPFQTSNQSDSFNNGNRKLSGRLVREDAVNEETASKSMDSNGGADATAKGEVPAKERVLMKVDKLRMSFERKKQKSEERRQSQQMASPTSPTSASSIQKQFNDLTVTSQGSENKNGSLPTFYSAPIQENGTDSQETKSGLYKKSSQNKLKFSYDASASARQIQHKIERAASPTGRTPSPINMNSPYEQFKSQVEASNLARPKGKGTSPQRHSVETSLIPQRSGSPTRSSAERERPKSTTDFTKGNHDVSDGQNLKSAMKETKIPVLKKSSGGMLSKSSEDISKLKKKTPFKDQLKNIFGRKKKKSKLYNGNSYDPDAEYNNHVTIVPESSFQQVDDELGFYPLSASRRANSASHILQGYKSDDDDDDDPVSAV
ncbi:uncharacterized protein LOC127874955 isoform X2 [Dreissena polymorpha]|uniref:uncharacterized protein LOC127874955 isoform X2 n=1 Tax=Dreissena polymorpha TaxID=45954 RepID=UPI0022643B17|nr:uncharacterized protein LOC127874955 isoform X2 [Dreissena polymorpha]